MVPPRNVKPQIEIGPGPEALTNKFIYTVDRDYGKKNADTDYYIPRPEPTNA